MRPWGLEGGGGREGGREGEGGGRGRGEGEGGGREREWTYLVVMKFSIRKVRC
jgi:hypothetical protein